MSLISPDIGKGYEKRATQNADPEKKGTWMQFFAGMDCALGKSGEKVTEVQTGDGTGQSSVHRAAFLDELVRLVPEEMVSFGKRVTAVHEELGSPTRGVRLQFADGTEARASAAVGCDGVKSNLRHVVIGTEGEASHPAFTGKYAYRGLIPMEKAAGLLGDGRARNSIMWCGEHGHVLTFPIEKGETMNVVAFKTKPSGKWEDEKWVLPIERRDMEEDFTGWGDSVKKILSLMEKPDVWALFDYPPAKTYHKGRTCLMGDAAHASTPHQGAGAGMALEDAFVLSRLLGRLEKEDDLENAFYAFDAMRRPRTQKLVTTSRDAGEVYDLEGEGVGDNMDAFKENLHARYQWIWEKDLEAHLQEAVQLMDAKRQ